MIPGSLGKIFLSQLYEKFKKETNSKVKKKMNAYCSSLMPIPLFRGAPYKILLFILLDFIVIIFLKIFFYLFMRDTETQTEGEAGSSVSIER